MKKSIGWAIGIAIASVFALLVLWAIFGLWGVGGMHSGYGMMGRGLFFSPLSWFGMALMWLAPVSILVLLVLGAISLFNAIANSSHPKVSADLPSNTRSCQQCGSAAKADWNSCPYCGQKLA